MKSAAVETLAVFGLTKNEDGVADGVLEGIGSDIGKLFKDKREMRRDAPARTDSVKVYARIRPYDGRLILFFAICDSMTPIQYVLIAHHGRSPRLTAAQQNRRNR